MTEPSPLDVVSKWLSARLQARSQELAQLWLDRVNDVLRINGDRVPSREVLDHILNLIQEIADYIAQPYGRQVAGQTWAVRKAMQLCELRYTRQTSAHQLLREYQILGEVLDEFCQQELAAAEPPPDPLTAVRVVSRVLRRVRFVQQQTLEIFVAKYADTISRQTEQLQQFSSLVSREIYRPLGVLQVMTKALTVKDGDVDSVRMMDIFNRSVAHLTEITGKLERLVRIARTSSAQSTEQRVDLSAVAADVVEQLEDMAVARDVEVRVHEPLPVLHVDAVCAELVFVNLIANGIKYSDPDKRRRVVEITAVKGQPQPSVEVRDNGIGIPAEKLQRLVKELVRPPRPSVQAPPRGLGLGLSVVRECMDDAGGWVRVESREGIGTTFTLAWPAPDGWSKIADSSERS
jgi:signal transduction histidine kinase